MSLYIYAGWLSSNCYTGVILYSSLCLLLSTQYYRQSCRELLMGLSVHTNC